MAKSTSSSVLSLILGPTDSLFLDVIFSRGIGLSMEELHVMLPRVLEWLVRCMVLRRDIERFLSPCHPVGKKDPIEGFLR